MDALRSFSVRLIQPTLDGLYHGIKNHFKDVSRPVVYQIINLFILTLFNLTLPYFQSTDLHTIDSVDI